MSKLTKVGFEAWLQTKSPRTKVGSTLDVVNLGPVTRFVNATGVRTTEIPAWVRKFNTRIENRSGYSISASAALNILREV